MKNSKTHGMSTALISLVLMTLLVAGGLPAVAAPQDGSVREGVCAKIERMGSKVEQLVEAHAQAAIVDVLQNQPGASESLGSTPLARALEADALRLAPRIASQLRSSVSDYYQQVIVNQCSPDASGTPAPGGGGPVKTALLRSVEKHWPKLQSRIVTLAERKATNGLERAAAALEGSGTGSLDARSADYVEVLAERIAHRVEARIMKHYERLISNRS